MTRRQFLALVVPLLLLLVGYAALSILERTGAMAGPPWDADFARWVRDRMGEEFAYGLGDRRAQEKAYFDALNAYVRAFDARAGVVPPWELERSRQESSGQYVGVGVRIDPPVLEEGVVASVRISGVKPGGPAAKAGVKVGDLVVAVGGVPVVTLCAGAEAPLGPLSLAIMGERGTAVTLRLRDDAGAEREAAIVRDAIDEGSVFGVRFVDEARRIGYARIRNFHADTGRSVEEALRRLLAEDMRGLVLDVRRNTGGLLEQAVDVADLFLDSGVIVRVVGRSPGSAKVHRATKERTVDAALPVAVLVDEGTASASEVLAGALQDHRRAVVVGTRTYGKFTVQTIEERPMEFGTAMFRRTTAIYETPLGHHYPRLEEAEDPLAGLEPDLLVRLDAAEQQTMLTVFEDERYADWDPGRQPRAAGFADPQIAAATALLTGDPYYPRIAGVQAR